MFLGWHILANVNDNYILDRTQQEAINKYASEIFLSICGLIVS